MKILVVDDEKLLVKGIKFNLENDGYEVVTGCDGMEAAADVDDRHAEGGGQMAGAGVWADKDVHLLDQGGGFTQGAGASEVEDSRSLTGFKLGFNQFLVCLCRHDCCERLFYLRAGQDDVKPLLDQSCRDIDEPVERPALFIDRQAFADVEATDRPAKGDSFFF